MISLKFPPLHKLLVKDNKELADDDPKNGVVVKNGHAIVVTHRSMVFFNLKSYFRKTNSIDDEKVMGELMDVLDYMDGKMFYKSFWEELTKGAIMSVENNILELDGAVRKDLFYRDVYFDDEVILTALEMNVSSDIVAIKRSALYVEPLFDILNNLKGLVKKDAVALEYIGATSNVRFTFEENPWIFGITATDPALSSKAFLFNPMSVFFQEISE